MKQLQKRNGRILSLFLICMLSLSSVLTVNAGLPTGNFDVNVYIGTDEILNIQKEIWQTMRSWGMTEESVAGVMGNMMSESGCDPTTTQDRVPWSSVVYGQTGLGLTQWTYYTRQDELFATAAEMEKSWLDLEPQLAQLKKELESNRYVSWEDFRKSTDLTDCTNAFLVGYENPRVHNLSDRVKTATEIFERFTGTTVENVGSTDDNEKAISETNLITKEWDLMGMPERSHLQDDVNKIILPEYSNLSYGEKYSIETVKQNIEMKQSESLFDLLRTAVVFIGLLLLLYSIFLMLAWVFDKSNQFIEISMLRILTMGKVEYTSDKSMIGKDGFISGSKLVRIIIICDFIGFFLISGGVFLWVTKLITFITNL